MAGEPRMSDMGLTSTVEFDGYEDMELLPEQSKPNVQQSDGNDDFQ
jgi:hypothetical protein